MRASGLPVRFFVARFDDQANLFNTCRQGFFDDQLQRSFVLTIAVNKLLKRQSVLLWSRGRDDRFSYLHGGFLDRYKDEWLIQRVRAFQQHNSDPEYRLYRSLGEAMAFAIRSGITATK